MYLLTFLLVVGLMKSPDDVFENQSFVDSNIMLFEEQIQSPKLVLYYRPGCPFCTRVLNYLQQLDKNIPLKDIREEDFRDELLSVGGRQQVPCLIVDGKPIYESLDIIYWISENQELLPAT